MSGDDGLPRPAADAVSLYTIADHDDYATQEQEDADYALALSLEEEENRIREVTRHYSPATMNEEALIVQQREALIIRAEARGYRHTDTTTPYRDDPHDDPLNDDDADALTPYRDDPDAAAADGDNGNVEAQTGSTMVVLGRQPLRQCMRLGRSFELMLLSISARLGKQSGCVVVLVVVFLSVLVGGTLLVFAWGGTLSDSPKDRAFRSSGSVAYSLVLPKLYPELDTGASNDCRRAWEKYASNVWCHEGILSSAWDKGDGKVVQESKMNPWAYSQWVCVSTCRDNLRRLETPMWNACGRRTDRFDLDKYGSDGRQYFRKEEVEAGPLQVAQSIMARYNSLCDTPVQSKKNEWGTYAADMWMRWGIADGKDAAPDLQDLSEFVAATSRHETLQGSRKAGSVEVESRHAGSLQVRKDKLTYDVEVPPREIGPGDEETDCGYSMLRWLERKMRSFEYGLILTPTGEPMGLDVFNTMMVNATNRCKEPEVGGILNKVHEMWSQYGWWCLWQPCRDQEKSISPAVVQLLHGTSENDSPLVDIRTLMAERGAPKKALQALHDGLLTMPCGIWIDENDLKQHIIPSDYRVRHLCSTDCRNAVDLLQRQHGDTFADAARVPGASDVFQAWDLARGRLNKTCKGPSYDAITTDQTPFCAPGYAVLGHPEWILDGTPSRKDILGAFAPAIDKLADSLPHHIPKPGSDADSQRNFARKLSESACNGCSSQLLIGTNPHWRTRITEFLDDDEVDSEEYRRVAKLFFTTYARMAGNNDMPEWRLRELWQRLGLD